jgi:protein TonB
MFEESLIESVPSMQTRSRWPALASIGVQGLLVAVLLIVPILRPEVLQLTPPRLIVLPTPVLRPVPPPPQREVVRVSEAAVSLSPLQQPQRLPARSSLQTDASPVDAPTLPFGTPGPPSAAPISAVVAVGPAGTGSAVGGPASAVATVREPLLISTGVMAGRLLAPIQPVYPAIARVARMEGSVVVQAVISKTGRIESAHVVSGPAMLQAAALAAVREARYRPFLLNNEPTEVETTITINFRLGNGED